MLNVAHELGWIQKVPKIKKPKVSFKDEDYNYLRTKEKIFRFLDGACREGKNVYMLYATAIYTGMRAEELAGMKWSDIDFKKKIITIQRSYNGPTKSGNVRYIPMLNSLQAKLMEWKMESINDFVFPNERGDMLKESSRIFQEKLQKVLIQAKFPTIMKNGKPRHYIVFHDLRHTFASHWVMNGGDIYKLQKILGHSSVDVTIYS